jgi:hypothetical protein
MILLIYLIKMLEDNILAKNTDQSILDKTLQLIDLFSMISSKSARVLPKNISYKLKEINKSL